MPSTIEEVYKAAQPGGLAVVAISIRERRETVQRWVDAHIVSFTILLDTDGRATEDYGVSATPTVFLVAPDGTLRGKAVGTKPWASATGRALLEALGKS